MYKLKGKSSLYDKNKFLTEEQFELIPEHHKLLFEKVNRSGEGLYGNPFGDGNIDDYNEYLKTVAEITRRVKNRGKKAKTPEESYSIKFMDSENSEIIPMKNTMQIPRVDTKTGAKKLVSDYTKAGYIYDDVTFINNSEAYKYYYDQKSNTIKNINKPQPVQPMSSTTPESINPFPYEPETDIESGDDFYWDEPYFEDDNEE